MIGRLLVNDQVRIDNIAYAATFLARGRGWLGYERTPLQGIWLPATAAVHTWGMRIALDLLWLDERNYCCAIETAVTAWRIRHHRQAKSVVELRCGLLRNAKGAYFSWTE